MTKNNETKIPKVRQSNIGSKLSGSQYDESKSVAEIMHRGIRKNGKFREKLTDYSHAFARGEKFDAMKAEIIIRDQFKAQYGETMNQMRLGLKERQENLPEMADRDALEYARMIEPLIRDGETMPFYRAYDYVGSALAEKLNITETGAKELMTISFREVEGRELYDFGKALEKKFIVPERDVEQQAREPDQNYVVIFDDLKRFARDTRFHLDLRDAFRLRGAQIECLNFKFEDTPEGEFIETIMAAQGALERKQNGRQVAKKMKARMQSGYWVHAAPVGYKYEIVKTRGRMLFPNGTLAIVVHEAFEGFASGRFGSQAEVRRFFELHPDFPRNKKGDIPNQRVADVLNNPLYTGHICSKTYGIDWLKGQHEALISIDLLDKVQERLKGSAKVRVRKNIGNDFAARGFVSCGDCGGPLSSSWSQRARPQLCLLPLPSQGLCQLRQVYSPRQAGG